MADSSVLERDAMADAVDALLLRVATGDQPAFEALYRSTSGKLLGICLRVLSDRTEAEDVLQDVFVTIWHKASQFDPARAGAWTWLGALVRNRAIDRKRALPSALQREPLELAETLADGGPSPASYADAGQQRSRLEACLERLQAKQQVLIRTAFFDGATYDELAARSGSPLGSVKSWIRRGLLQLRECLGQ